MQPKCVVGSTSQHKIRATDQALKTEGIVAEIIGCKTVSGINEQPVGLEETVRGALNRLRDARKTQPKADLWVSMESGILLTHEIAFDISVVAVQTKEGKRTLATSAGIPFPMEMAREAERRGFEKHTVGSVIAERLGGDGTDPHYTITEGRSSRIGIMRDALRLALAQLKKIV